MLSKLQTYRFTMIPIRIPAGFCAEIDKLILKLIQKFNGPGIVKTITAKLEDSRFPIAKLTTRLQ